MNPKIKPREYKFRKVKEQVEEVLETYSYCIEIEEFDVNLGWEEFERSVSFKIKDSSINLILNPNREIEGLERTLMSAVFHLEFKENSVHEHIEFGWQEIAEFTYASVRGRNNVFQADEADIDELEKRWPELKESLKNEPGEPEEELYRHKGPLGKAIGRQLVEEGLEPEDILDFTRSDVLEAGDRVFGT